MLCLYKSRGINLSSDKEREVERERTTDKGRGVSRAGAGRERATVFKSKTGVAVVEATVARLTGGGKFVVQPIGGPVGVDVGDQVIIFILNKKLLGRSALLATQTKAHT
jgi:hypothetical protein